MMTDLAPINFHFICITRLLYTSGNTSACVCVVCAHWDYIIG